MAAAPPGQGPREDAPRLGCATWLNTEKLMPRRMTRRAAFWMRSPMAGPYAFLVIDIEAGNEIGLRIASSNSIDVVKALLRKALEAIP